MAASLLKAASFLAEETINGGKDSSYMQLLEHEMKVVTSEIISAAAVVTATSTVSMMEMTRHGAMDASASVKSVAAVADTSAPILSTITAAIMPNPVVAVARTSNRCTQDLKALVRAYISPHDRVSFRPNFFTDSGWVVNDFRSLLVNLFLKII